MLQNDNIIHTCKPLYLYANYITEEPSTHVYVTMSLTPPNRLGNVTNSSHSIIRNFSWLSSVLIMIVGSLGYTFLMFPYKPVRWTSTSFDSVHYCLQPLFIADSDHFCCRQQQREGKQEWNRPVGTCWNVKS